MRGDHTQVLQNPSQRPDDMDVRQAQRRALLAVSKVDILHPRKAALQICKRNGLLRLEAFRMREQREDGLAIAHELRRESLHREQRDHGLESVIAPYFVSLVRLAGLNLVFPTELVEDDVDDGGGVGVDVAPDCKEGDAAVGDSEIFEVGAREDGWLGQLRVGDTASCEDVVDFLGVGRGLVREEDRSWCLGRHGGQMVLLRCRKMWKDPNETTSSEIESYTYFLMVSGRTNNAPDGCRSCLG